MSEKRIVHTEKIDLGDGYEVQFAHAGSYDWFCTSVFAPVATTLEEGALVRIARRSVRKNPVREVRWAIRMKARHEKATRLARQP